MLKQCNYNISCCIIVGRCDVVVAVAVVRSVLLLLIVATTVDSLLFHYAHHIIQVIFKIDGNTTDTHTEKRYFLCEMNSKAFTLDWQSARDKHLDAKSMLNT